MFIVRFAAWLYTRSPNSPTLINEFGAHVPFIQRLDATFAEGAEVSVSVLLDQFGSKALRRHLLVTEFLKQTLGLTISAKQRADSSCEDLVADTLRESATAPWGALLADYVNALDAGKLAARTRRMYVRTAAHLCQAAQLSPDHRLTTPILGHYLSHNPGARTNIARFVRHCFERWGWEVSMPARATQRAVENARELSELFNSRLDAVLAEGIVNASADDLGALLATAYGYSITQFNDTLWNISSMGCEFFLSCGGTSLRIPPELKDIAQRWIDLTAQRAERR